MGPRVMAAIASAERLGFPEARIPLAEIVIELALSPKSNSAEMAIDRALNDIRSKNIGNVPDNITAHTKTYLYPHNYKNDYVKQQYLPNELIGASYYIPKENLPDLDEVDPLVLEKVKFVPVTNVSQIIDCVLLSDKCEEKNEKVYFSDAKPNVNRVSN